jgi:eukaryotic-like serine/threonine-protein kinase
MATSTESNPPVKSGSSSPVKSSESAQSSLKDARGLSSLNDSMLEKSVLRRGLATNQEIEACKAHRNKLAAKDETKGLLEIMVAAKVITSSQSLRLLKEVTQETQRKLEIPGYQIIDKLGKGSMGIVYKARQVSVDRVVALKILLEVLAQNKEFIKRFDR